ncbi:hypothetical protein LSH36_167g00020 [Paralvinella palmiformis]|uniref:VWFA domain-containing protein n=1 Tax=Paralvinella palmiformis TaxID=53620 RepID=A0AAD9N6F8_9ANNE|nr:hypothetical protein LSH36_167g00020 [Paralvinella palmiformis]
MYLLPTARPSVTRPLNRGLLDPDCDVCESLLDFDTDYNYVSCDVCWKLLDETSDFMTDCIRYMSDLEKMEMRHKCLENFEDFNKDLSDECYTKRGKNVTLPECETCRGDNLCIEVVVDYSPSAYSRSGWRPFIYWIYYSQLDIGRNKSLYVNIDISNACKDKHKYGIIVTDGYDSTTRIMNAVENIPEDITMIVIGLERSNVDNLLIMARNNPDNVYTTENFSLHSAISDDLRRRHR